MKKILGATDLIDKHTCGFCDAVAVAVALHRNMIKKTYEVCTFCYIAILKTRKLCNWLFRRKKNCNFPDRLKIYENRGDINEKSFREVMLA